MNRKPAVLQQLNLIPVYFDDESETSPDWFQISNFPLRLTSGKNLFKLRGHPTNLKIGANIDFEVLDYNGDPIYAELVNYIDEDDSRIIAIYIYEDTSPGDCTITIIGSAADEFVTEEWIDRYNVKWSRTVAVNPGTPNVSEIIFDTDPEVTVAELIAPQLNRTYANNLQTASYSTGTVRYFNYNEQPALELSNGFFTSDMSNGTITVSNPVLPLPAIDFVISSSTYVSTIKKILTPTTALLNTAYQVTDTQNILNHTYNTFALSSYALTYEATPIYTPTQNSHSFLDLKINKLEPATGDISRIKIFSNNSGTIGTWELINDIELEKTEIFETNTGSIYPIPPIGVFNKQADITDFWDGQAFDGVTTLAPPILTYTTASILNAMTISSSIDLSNKNTVLVAKIKSAYAGTFAENSSYKLTLDAAGIKTGSESPILSIYVSGSSFYQDPTDYFNQEFPYEFGKRIGELQTLVSNQKFNEYVIDFEADYSGTGVLILVVESGNWHVSNIHVTSNNDPGFSPNYTRIKSVVPTTHKSNNQLSFKVEYYNVQGEKSKYISYVNDNNWQGGNHYIDGDFSMITGSVWVGDSLGNGIGITGNQNAGHVMSAGYQGFDSGIPGFLMWSGSVLPGETSQGTPYSGVGLELYENNKNYFRYSTSDNILDIATQTFILGDIDQTYIYGDTASLLISSSNFNLDANGNVKITGNITATGGNIGGFEITQDAITGSGFYLSGSATGNGFFISSSKFNVKANGDITASSALFSGSVSVTGNINATTGNIGGFAITQDAITGSGVLISGSATTGTQFFISSSKFNIKGHGDVTGSNVLFTGGKIAGFTISDSTLSNANNFYISGSASVNDFFISSSNFNVKASGDITGSSVLFTGGKIGSFTLTNNALSGINNVGATTFLISSSVDASNLSTAFFISSSKFNVRQDGTVSGSQVLFDGGKIGGFTIDSSKITGTNIVIDSAGSIQTSDYASNLKGWQISAAGNGSAEFENAKIRGTLSTAVFEKTSVNAVGGQLYVANSTTLTGSSAPGASPNGNYTPTQTTMSVENVTGFENGEILTAKKFTGTGFATEYLYVNSASRDGVGDDLFGRIYVTRAYGNGVLGNSSSLGESPSAGQSYSGSQVIVSTGKQGTGFIRINANPNDQATPYIDIVERTGSGIYDVALKARLGDLSGLANSNYVFGKSSPGFGLATDNVFLQGGIIANTGSIGGINMASSKLFTGTGTYNNSNTGFYLDNNGQFSLKDKLAWDGTTLSISGVINIEGGTGFATPASVTASLNAATSSLESSITSLSSSLLATINSVSSSFSASIASFDSSSIISTIVTNADNKIIKPNDAPIGGPGLFLASNYLGYYSGSAWNSYISSSGEFLFKKDDNNQISFGNNSFILKVSDQAIISGSQINLITPKFFLGDSTQYISGSSGKLVISSSNFNLDAAGNVTMSGKITAATGRLGGFEITQNAITGSGFLISGSAQNNDFFISSSKFNVKASGDVTASSALFSGSVSVTGNINATTGNIGGFAITRDAITGSGVLISGSATTGTQFFISSSKFNIKGNGDVTGSNVLFTGGKIAGFTISDSTLSNSTNFFISGSATGNGFFISSSNFNVKANGDVTGSSVLFTGGTFSGTVNVGGTNLTTANTLNSNNTSASIGLGNVSNLTPQNQTQTGLISGTTITGGGITLSNGGNIKGGQTAFNTGTGFFLGYDTAYKFSIGNASTNYLTWDGSTFAVGGTIAATAGNIGGFAITQNAITGSGFYLSGSATGNGFFISSSNFNVKASGDITASNALFSGNVSAVNFSKKMVTVTNDNSGSYFQTVTGGINLIFDGSLPGGEKTMVMEIDCPTNPSLNIKDIIVSNTGSALMPQVEVIISQNNVTFDNANIKTGTAGAIR